MADVSDVSLMLIAALQKRSNCSCCSRLKKIQLKALDLSKD